MLKNWRYTLWLSIGIVNFLPAIYFFGVLSILENVIIPNSVLAQLLYFLFIVWSSLGAFGFYRLYHAVIAQCKNGIFQFMEEELCKRDFSYDILSHLFWFFIYIMPGPLFLWFIN